ncbi:MAG: thioredoxin family protein [Desulfobacteraceae bacterium]|nr:thioredoxin family protein [Desulfobacteraceae bacterium]
MAFSAELVSDFNKIPEKGKVTMLELGAKKCIPCKMMAPIIEKLEKTYAGKASIVFIDVWKNNDQAGRFNIQGIPTQIFFNKDGKEVFRHTGFLDEESIIKQLTSMGVAAPDSKKKG